MVLIYIVYMPYRVLYLIGDTAMTVKMVNLMIDYKECCEVFADEGLPILAELLYIRQNKGGFMGTEPEVLKQILIDDSYCTQQEADAVIDSGLDVSLVYRWINRASFYGKTCICGTSHTSFPNEHSDWCTALKTAYGFCDGCHGCSVPCGKAKS